MPDNQKNSGNHPGSLSKIRKIFGLNIGTMLFGCLLIYMLFSAVLYLTSTNIESYLVISGPLSRNETYTGLALREESVHQAETSGYVSYYAREGSKINASGAVYGISSTQPSETTSELSAEQLSQIRSNMLSFSQGFNSTVHIVLNMNWREISFSMHRPREVVLRRFLLHHQILLMKVQTVCRQFRQHLMPVRH